MKMITIKKANSDSAVAVQDHLFDKDIWYADEIGAKPSTTHSAYRLNFSKIYPLWFRQIVKRYVYFQSTLKAFWTLSSYITGLRHFGNFIISCEPDLKPNEINRSIILNYLNYLNEKGLKTVAKQMAILHLRTFLEIVAQEAWLSITKSRLIYNTDIPKNSQPIPRFIPEVVLNQLKDHLPLLPGHYRRLIFVLMETGRRISEICTLPYDCIYKDDDAYFLRVNENKTKKSYSIPITDECAAIIKEQQAHHLFFAKKIKTYLFLAHNKLAITSHLAARNVHNVLNNLAKEKDIRDDNGKIWHFSTHQFRHTVGTRMINAGVSQYVVQRFLGHETSEMTSRYAYIHDATLKKEFFKFQGLINVHGDTISNTRVRMKEENWLKQNIMAQALPNGYCGLPAKQQRCPHANACLTCASFRTDERFLPQHESHLKGTEEIIAMAEKAGWQRQVEMNQEIKINLEKIIKTLRDKKHESA